MLTVALVALLHTSHQVHIILGDQIRPSKDSHNHPAQENCNALACRAQKGKANLM